MRSNPTNLKLLPSTLAAFALYSATAHAQELTPPTEPPAVDTPNEEVATPPAPEATPTEEAPTTPALIGEESAPTAEATEQTPPEQEEYEDGIRLNDAALNTVFEVLAREAGLSYFHNNRIAGEEFKVNGYLRDGDPLTKMEDLAFNNALTLHRKGNTIYALTSDQLNQLPATEWTYQLRYLRSENMKEHIRELVSPLLSPNTGIVNYEEKTNTLIIIDTPYKIQRVQSLLERVDKAKGQIVVEVKIFKVNNDLAQNIGVDWEQALGRATSPENITALLGINSVLGLPSRNVTSTTTDGGGDSSTTTSSTVSDLVFSPSEISTVIRALNQGDISKLQSNPVLITEDNEPANISIIDRIPIITTEFSGTGDSREITEEVRYKIDEEDSTDPETTREIGTTISVTPTLLPDGTIRLKMRPRNATVTRTIQGQTSAFPQVLESTVTTIARIPDGHSLVVGGFYSESTVENESKVPLLGDIPGVQLLFKNKRTEKQHANLVFVVTPTSYNPANHASHHRTHGRLKTKLQSPSRKTTFDDPRNHNLQKSDLKRTLENVQKEAGLTQKKRRGLKFWKNNSTTNKRYKAHR